MKLVSQDNFSSFLCAFLIFLGANQIFGVADSTLSLTDAARSLQSGFIKRYYQRTKHEHPVVLLAGSSILLDPMRLLENQHPPTGSRLAGELQKLGSPCDPVVMAAEGFGPTDDLVMLRSYIAHCGAPAVVLLALFPGSLIDRSYHFRTLAFRVGLTLTEIPAYSGDLEMPLKTMALLALERVFPLYSSRRTIVEQITKRFLAAIVGRSPDNQTPDLERLYVQDRTSISYENLSYQFRVLEKLVSRLKQAGSTCILVNMPLRSDSLDFRLPYYEQYFSRLKALGSSPGVEFLDLNTNRQYTDDCFLDRHHLNSKGGQMLMDAFAREISRALRQHQRS
jgi:hypothetical protein